MMIARLMLCAGLLLAGGSARAAQQSPPAAPSPKTSADAAAKINAEAETELEKTVANAGNDSAALVRNLKGYLGRFPDAPRKAAVFRALVEACQQLRNNGCELEYAERLIAVRPDDSQMMLLAVHLLEQQGDDASLTHAAGYVSRVLDRVEKTAPEEKPARESLEEWQKGQGDLRSALYYVRGRVEKSQRRFDEAARDLQASDAARPNALAAQMLGEIAEMQGNPAKAIEEYTRAFALPEEGPAGKADRRELRRKLGNVWRQAHGSEQGLGEAILAAYDRLSAPPADAKPRPAARNKDAQEPFAFVVRRVDGTPLPLAPLKGKIVVMSFWATWCGPCRELEPLLKQVAAAYAGSSDVTFLAVNTDDDEARVPPFMENRKWDFPVVYADGLDGLLDVDSLPTVLVLGRGGEIVYRATGFEPDGFSQALTAAIQSARSNAQ